MLFGGQLFKPFASPDEWIGRVKEMGFNAAYFPLGAQSPDNEIDAYAKAAEENCIAIAEVGAWSNPMSPDPAEAKKALQYCKDQLHLAERVGAYCCVNISGSCGPRWDGPSAENFTQLAFDKVVAVTQEIIDAVNPVRTFYTLELMPWMYPYSADTYADLIKAVNRPAFAVHMDPTNIIASPLDYFNNGEIIRGLFAKLGLYVKSCHAKDIHLSDSMTVHLSEVRPGLGKLDYRAYVDCLKQLKSPAPLMIEHLGSHEEVAAAAEYIRSFF
jgi:sugar phosphate isomerase/epimerase